MKKILMTFAAVFLFAVAANAIVFRSTQSVCSNGGRIVFQRSGVVQFWEDDLLQAEGTYTIDGNYIIVDGSMRLTANHNGVTLKSVTFRGTTFYKCN